MRSQFTTSSIHGLKMSGFVRVFVMLFVGLALGIGYNAWPDSGSHYAAQGGRGPITLDLVSYVIGLGVGMALWQCSSVPWAALPARLQEYFVAQMQVYQFAVLGAACLLILIYF